MTRSPRTTNDSHEPTQVLLPRFGCCHTVPGEDGKSRRGLPESMRVNWCFSYQLERLGYSRFKYH